MAANQPKGNAATKPVERRISFRASQRAARNRSSTITDRRISLHLERRSNQNLLATEKDGGEETPAVLNGEGGEGKEELLDDDTELLDFKMTILKSEGRRELYALVTSDMWELFIMIVVIINSLLLMVAATVNIRARTGWYMEVIEMVFAGIFLTEAVVKLYVFRIRYFFNFWNVLDFVIVVIVMVDVIMSIFQYSFKAYGPVTVIRLLRLVRALQSLRVFKFLRAFRFFSTLQVILVTLKRSAKPMFILALVMTYVIYLFAVIGRGLYGELDFRFRSIPKTMFTLYLLLTLDDWFYMVIAIQSKGVYHSFYYLFIYIFVNVYVLLDLFVAVICDNFQSAWLEEKEMARDKKAMHTGSFANMQDELDEDDEADSLLDAVISENDRDSDFEPIDNDLNAYTIQKHYPDAPEEEQHLLEQFFDVAPALECNYFKLLDMQHVLDMMVDVAADVSEDAA